MRKAHKPEDPWAGFVDVLSNIVMVVVFLVVLLGLAIFALGQRLTKAAVEQALQEERARVERLSKPSNDQPNAKPYAASEPKKDEINPDENLQPSASDPERMEVEKEVASPILGVDANKTEKELIEIVFPDGQFKISEADATKLRGLAVKALPDKDLSLKIVGSIDSKTGSISEARRLAYYRALSVRSVLLAAGYPAENMQVTIEELDETDEEVVKVFGLKGGAP